MSFENLSINRVIVHEIYKRTDGRDVVPFVNLMHDNKIGRAHV